MTRLRRFPLGRCLPADHHRLWLVQPADGRFAPPLRCHQAGEGFAGLANLARSRHRIPAGPQATKKSQNPGSERDKCAGRAYPPDRAVRQQARKQRAPRRKPDAARRWQPPQTPAQRHEVNNVKGTPFPHRDNQNAEIFSWKSQMRIPGKMVISPLGARAKRFAAVTSQVGSSSIPIPSVSKTTYKSLNSQSRAPGVDANTHPPSQIMRHKSHIMEAK
jgi:hypothetical protein